MTALRLAVAVMVLTLAGCALGERPALAPDGSDDLSDPYFLNPGFMGGFENRVHDAPPPVSPLPFV